MLQGFSWESCKSSSWWNVIKNNAEEIGNDFEYVWFPPCSDSNSNQGYLPRKLYVFDAKYGTKEQLKSAITAISPAKAIADVVINHRCGTTGWGDFTEPSFGTEKGVNIPVAHNGSLIAVIGITGDTICHVKNAF